MPAFLKVQAVSRPKTPCQAKEAIVSRVTPRSVRESRADCAAFSTGVLLLAAWSPAVLRPPADHSQSRIYLGAFRPDLVVVHCVDVVDRHQLPSHQCAVDVNVRLRRTGPSRLPALLAA